MKGASEGAPNRFGVYLHATDFASKIHYFFNRVFHSDRRFLQNTLLNGSSFHFMKKERSACMVCGFEPTTLFINGNTPCSRLHNNTPFTSNDTCPYVSGKRGDFSASTPHTE